MTDKFTECGISARRLALAWRAVSKAASVDTHEDNPALFKTVLVEQHREGLRLVATNRRLLLWSWVGYEDLARGSTAPDIDEKPQAQIVCSDQSGLAKTLWAWIIRSTKLADFIDYRCAALLHVGQLAENDQPTLDPGLERQGLVVDFLGDVIAVPVLELPYPDWRVIEGNNLGTDVVDRVGFAQSELRNVAGVKPDVAGPVWLESTGPNRPMRVKVPGEPAVYGFLMPVRSADPVDDDDEPEGVSEPADVEPAESAGSEEKVDSLAKAKRARR